MRVKQALQPKARDLVILDLLFRYFRFPAGFHYGFPHRAESLQNGCGVRVRIDQYPQQLLMRLQLRTLLVYLPLQTVKHRAYFEWKAFSG
jgi:hypothetical protein